jgi:small redox-active disulfide protein 2
MTIQILGSGCAKCALLAKQAQEAVDELGLSASIEKITDPWRISDMGVMVTPALGIDNVIRSAGRVLSKDQIVALLKMGPLTKAGA